MRRPSVPDVLDAVASYFGVQVADIVGVSRTRHLLAPRRVVCLLCRWCGMSMAETGRVLGRDHSTISAMLRRAIDEDVADAQVLWGEISEQLRTREAPPPPEAN